MVNITDKIKEWVAELTRQSCVCAEFGAGSRPKWPGLKVSVAG